MLIFYPHLSVQVQFAWYVRHQPETMVSIMLPSTFASAKKVIVCFTLLSDHSSICGKDLHQPFLLKSTSGCWQLFIEVLSH